MRTKNFVFVAAILSTGCASMEGQGPSTSLSNNDLYGGREARVVQEAKSRTSSVEEAVATADQAFRSGDSDRALYEYVRALDMISQIEAQDKKAKITVSKQSLFVRVGALHLAKGNHTQALTAYKSALAIDPANLDAKEGVGLCQLGLKQYSEAQAILAQVINHDGARWRSYNALAIIADLQKRPSEADSYYQKALSASPVAARPVLLNNLGYSRYLAGDLNGAESNLKQATQLAPDYKRAWTNLGLVRARNGNYDESLTAFSHAVDSAQALNNVGYTSMLNGNRKKAEEYINRAVAESTSYYERAEANLRALRSGS